MDTSVVDVELGIEAKPGLESLDTDGSIDVLCLACDSPAGDFTVRSMRRRTPNPHDVVIDMKYCGVCHSDLKPENLLLVDSSPTAEVKIADFGVAQGRGRLTTTMYGEVKGKIAYMSPEQVEGGTIDGRSDLFSVGIVLAELLTGRRLFVAPTEIDGTKVHMIK